MARHASKSSKDEASKRSRWAIVVVAALVAAVPHAFFELPLRLFESGQTDAWWGISIWSSAILGGVGFLIGVDFSSRLENARFSTQMRTMSAIFAVLLFAVYMALRFEPLFSGMDSMRPWDNLELALLLYAGLWALNALFWQGFVQAQVARFAGRAARVLAAVVGPVLVALPFAASTAPDRVFGEYVPTVSLAALLLALVFETGVPVWATLLTSAAMGAAFIWFQQVLLL